MLFFLSVVLTNVSGDLRSAVEFWDCRIETTLWHGCIAYNILSVVRNFLLRQSSIQGVLQSKKLNMFFLAKF
jgi:hypothetical protein